MNEKTTEQVLLPESDLIPLALIAAEVGETVDEIAYQFGGEVETDDVGIRSVTATAARRFFTERDEQRSQQEEQRSRRAAKKTPTPILAGVPAVEGLTPFESMAAAGGGVVSPSEEFGGLEKPNFLEEELAAGRRTAAEKERLVKTLKKGLS